MIRFRRDGLRALEITGTGAELGLLAEDLKDIADGLGEWCAVTGEESTGFLKTIIFRTTKRAASLEPAGDAMVECRLPPPVLQRLLAEVQVQSGMTRANEEPVVVRGDELEIRVLCTGEAAV